MPEYEVIVDGKPKRIQLTQPTQNLFTAKIDDKPHKIELRTDKINPEEAFTIKIDDKSYKIQLPKLEQEKMIPVKVEEATFRVEVKNSSMKRATTSFEAVPAVSMTRTATQRQAAVEGAVTAPMTGKIVKVKVKKGEQVNANQVLCVIEAMKMENEITAPKAGTIQEINVSDGSPVSEGEILFIIN
jgi:biotin carboxyl carrier protein